MKKLLSILICGLLLCLPIVGCGKKADNTIRLNEVTHSIFYAPQYLAMEKGYFEEEGLEIELTNGGGADKSMTAVLSGGADIGLMGPEAAIYVYQEQKQDYVKIFGQLTKRDGSFLVSKTEMPDFDFSGLEGMSVIAGRKGGVPFMTLQYVFRQHGYTDGENITLRTDVDFANMAGAFLGGSDDLVSLFEPTASDVVRQGKGYLVASIGAFAGEVPYTAYMAKSSYIEEHPDIIEKFLRAIYRAQVEIETADVDEIVQALLPHFAGFTEEDIRTSVLSYREIDAWMKDPVMTEESFNRLQTIMEDAGELSERADFSKLVDNSFAQKIIAEAAA